MRKNKITLAVIAALAIVLLAFQSCKKENKNNVDNDNNKTETTLSNIDEYLISFKKRMETSTRDLEYISIDDAEWNLTALQNFELCDASISSSEMIVDTFYTDLRVKNDSVSLFELNNVFKDNVNRIRAKYTEIFSEYKNIYLINTKIDHDYRNDIARVMTVSYMYDGVRSGISCRFDSTDYWYDFGGKGKCGEYEGECIGRDAITEMNSKLQCYLPRYSNKYYRIYFTDISVYHHYGVDYPYCEDSPTPPYCLHWGESGSYRCLSPDELNWFLDKSLEMIDELTDNVESSTGKKHFHTEMGYDNSVGRDGRYMRLWALILKYGYINYTPIEPNL